MFFRSALGKVGWRGVGEKEACDWFIDEVTGASTLKGGDLTVTRLVPWNVAAIAFVWMTIFACLAFGVKWTGRIAYFTVVFPVLSLAVLCMRAGSLPGAGNGIKAFAGEWDVNVLTERPEVWSTAVAQVCFSIGLTSGIVGNSLPNQFAYFQF